MKSVLITGLALVVAGGSALMAGTFFAFSTFVTPALNQLPTPQAIAAMQRINDVIQRSAFMPVFLGTALASAALILIVARNWSQPGGLLILFGAGAYLIGTFGTTVLFNVPLNTTLAQALANNSQAWVDYYAPWMLGNHLRTLAAMAGTTAVLWGLWQTNQH